LTTSRITAVCRYTAPATHSACEGVALASRQGSPIFAAHPGGREHGHSGGRRRGLRLTETVLSDAPQLVDRRIPHAGNVVAQRRSGVLQPPRLADTRRLAPGLA